MRNLLGLLLAVVAAGLAIVGLLILVESVYIGVFANSSVVAEYRFGGEAMVSNGGWGYQSRGTYLLSGMLKSSLFLVPSVVLGWALFKEYRMHAT